MKNLAKWISGKNILIISFLVFSVNANALTITRDENTQLKINFPMELRHSHAYCARYEHVSVYASKSDSNGSFHKTNVGTADVCVEHSHEWVTKTVNQVIKFKGDAAIYKGIETYSLDVKYDGGGEYLVLTGKNDLSKTHSIRKNLFGAFIVE